MKATGRREGSKERWCDCEAGRKGAGRGSNRIKTHKQNINEPECNISMGQRNVWEKGCRIRSI